MKCEQVQTIELGVNKTSSCINKKFWIWLQQNPCMLKEIEFFKKLIDLISKSQRFAINVVYNAKIKYSKTRFELLIKQQIGMKPSSGLHNSNEPHAPQTVHV